MDARNADLLATHTEIRSPASAFALFVRACRYNVKLQQAKFSMVPFDHALDFSFEKSVQKLLRWLACIVSRFNGLALYFEPDH